MSPQVAQAVGGSRGRAFVRARFGPPAATRSDAQKQSETARTHARTRARTHAHQHQLRARAFGERLQLLGAGAEEALGGAREVLELKRQQLGAQRRHLRRESGKTATRNEQRQTAK